MKRYILCIAFALFSLICQQAFCEPFSAATYVVGGGRLGDKLMHYIKTKWVAYKHHLIFLYKPFKHSHHFALHTALQAHDMNFTSTIPFDAKIRVRNNTHVIKQVERNILYEVDFFFSDLTWGSWDEVATWHTLRSDKKFVDHIRDMIKPVHAIELVEIPSDKISVALHVRKGGGFDKPLISSDGLDDFDSRKPSAFADENWPLKFPPDRYYVDQIRALYAMLGEQPLHIHLFTDYQNPRELIERYSRVLNISNISFSCRKAGNAHDKNIIDDLFNMMRFDCFIRSASHFAQIADLLADYRIVIYPKAVEWVDKQLVVTQVGVIRRDR